MSKISIPCILAKISNRSKPVDWLKSDGTVPGSAPGGRRSCSVLTSVRAGRRHILASEKEIRWETLMHRKANGNERDLGKLKHGGDGRPTNWVQTKASKP